MKADILSVIHSMFYPRKYLMNFDKTFGFGVYSESLLDEHNCGSCQSIQTPNSHEVQIKMAHSKKKTGL
jgi:hypothetical protein